MDCREALVIIKEWDRVVVGGEEAMNPICDYEEAFRHIRECRKEKCSQVWREFRGAANNIDGVKILIDEDGKLPFIC